MDICKVLNETEGDPHQNSSFGAVFHPKRKRAASYQIEIENGLIITVDFQPYTKAKSFAEVRGYYENLLTGSREGKRLSMVCRENIPIKEALDLILLEYRAARFPGEIPDPLPRSSPGLDEFLLKEWLPEYGAYNF